MFLLIYDLNDDQRDELVFKLGRIMPRLSRGDKAATLHGYEKCTSLG